MRKFAKMFSTLIGICAIVTVMAQPQPNNLNRLGGGGPGQMNFNPNSLSNQMGFNQLSNFPPNQGFPNPNQNNLQNLQNLQTLMQNQNQNPQSFPPNENLKPKPLQLIQNQNQNAQSFPPNQNIKPQPQNLIPNQNQQNLQNLNPTNLNPNPNQQNLNRNKQQNPNSGPRSQVSSFPGTTRPDTMLSSQCFGEVFNAIVDERVRGLRQDDEIRQMKIVLTQLQGQVASLNKKMAIAKPLSQQLEQIIKDQSKKIGFTAELFNGTRYLAGSKIVFDTIKSNIGNAYNSATGDFVAPLDGIYMFSAFLIAESNAYHAQIMKNDQPIGYLYTHNANTWGSAATSIVTDLKKGDRVHVKSFDESLISNWSTFSGVLLSTIIP